MGVIAIKGGLSAPSSLRLTFPLAPVTRPIADMRLAAAATVDFSDCHRLMRMSQPTVFQNADRTSYRQLRQSLTGIKPGLVEVVVVRRVERFRLNVRFADGVADGVLD